VSASLPYFLPAPFISPVGTFGAFIRIRSRFPDRRALFDIGASGPWAGFVVALAATVIGLTHSTVLATPQEWHGFACGDSLLTAFLTRIVLHVDSAVVVLHPVAFAGWFGLFVTSLNLLARQGGRGDRARQEHPGDGLQRLACRAAALQRGGLPRLHLAYALRRDGGELLPHHPRRDQRHRAGGEERRQHPRRRHLHHAHPLH